MQVVPADWVKNSTSPQITAGTMADSYGYQWWVDDEMFMMQGYGGQFVYVLPAQDLVVVFTGALPQQRYFTPRSLLRNYIEAASMTIGLDGVFRIGELFGQRWACRGGWVNGETFIVEQEAFGKVLRRRATLSFAGDTLSFEIHDRVTGSVDIYSAKMATVPPAAK